MAMKKTVLNSEWTSRHLHPEFSSWLNDVKDRPYYAYCSICKSTFSLSNMGKQAITSHMKGAKHVKNFHLASSQSSQGTLATFLRPPVKREDLPQPAATENT